MARYQAVTYQARKDAAVAAWFLGPKAENKDSIWSLFETAFDAHVQARHSYFPTDPIYITEDLKSQPEYKQAMTKFQTETADLVQRLKNSVPFYSLRYQGHMLWDVTMPGLVGYFAAMFYNQNNTAVEASPVTTAFEYQVGFDLASLIGYPNATPPESSSSTTDNPSPCQSSSSSSSSSSLEAAAPVRKVRPFCSMHREEEPVEDKPNSDPNAPIPWGHVTCDGTVANIESMWAARNIKFFPLSFQMALKNPALSAAVNMTVPVYVKGVKTTRKIVDLTTWELLNLDIDDILALSDRFTAEYDIPASVLTNAMNPYTIQGAGFVNFFRIFGIKNMPVVFVTQSAHYSWPKAAAVLGIGINNLLKVPVDINGRMDMKELQRMINDLVDHEDPADRTAIFMVMGIAGSTEESTVDPIADIIDLRKNLQRHGVNFYVHTDGAWGGYYCAMMRKDLKHPPLPETTESLFHPDGVDQVQYIPFLPLSHYTERQLAAIKDCDSVTIDPHKSGLIQYPAGGLVYRNGTARTLITFDAPIVYHGQTDVTIGIYGVEGSKPGAAPTACYLSHRVIPLDRSGYGRILGQANFSCKKLYCAIYTMAADDDSFVVEMYSHVPKNIIDALGGVTNTKTFLRQRIVDASNEEILSNPKLLEILRNIGPDLSINAFAINFKDENGALNTSIETANKIMNLLFQDLDMAYMINSDNPIQKLGVQRKPLFFTSSEFETNAYGKSVGDLKARLGFNPMSDVPLSFLVNTVMDPWQTGVRFTKTIQQILRASILRSIGSVTDQPDTHGFLCIHNEETGSLFWHHFPMFHATPHQYQVTVVADFVSEADRKAYFDAAKKPPPEGFDNNLVMANSSPMILHEIVYSTSNVLVDCYYGMPLPPSTEPPPTPFMQAELVIRDFTIFEHFDTKALYPSRLTYLLYGRDGNLFIEHLITQCPNWDHVAVLSKIEYPDDETAEPLSCERLAVGLEIRFARADGFYDENPLGKKNVWKFSYLGEGGVIRSATLTIAKTLWFNNQRVNASGH